MTEVSHCSNHKDGFLAKDDDRILEKWKEIGNHFFKGHPLLEEISEIKVISEYGNISVSHEDGMFWMKQESETVMNKRLIEEIKLYSNIDRTDALRLAGLLIAWAADKDIHDGNVEKED